MPSGREPTLPFGTRKGSYGEAPLYADSAGDARGAVTQQRRLLALESGSAVERGARQALRRSWLCRGTTGLRIDPDPALRRGRAAHERARAAGTAVKTDTDDARPPPRARRPHRASQRPRRRPRRTRLPDDPRPRVRPRRRSRARRTRRRGGTPRQHTRPRHDHARPTRVNGPRPGGHRDLRSPEVRGQFRRKARKLNRWVQEAVARAELLPPK